MRVMSSLVLLLVAIAGASAQSPEPPLSDTRLTVHTLLREDVFAGFMANDMVRFTRAERNIEQLLKDRPDQRGNLLAWRGDAAMQRAVLAHDAGNNGEFLKQLHAARAAFAEAAQQTSGNEGAAAITGGSYSVFADRLPEPHRASAWADAYANYSLLWKQQGSASTSSLSIIAAKCLADSFSRRSERAGPRRWPSISIACSRCCRARRTRQRHSSGRRIPQVRRRPGSRARTATTRGACRRRSPRCRSSQTREWRQVAGLSAAIS